ncbi:unnamed protein product [Rhizophagus irregularis]|nr:unnamed protein product [Rhizophagus irregularis]
MRRRYGVGRNRKKSGRGVEDFMETSELTNFFKTKVIKAAESHDVIKRYTTLNSDFTKRVKEENWETDTKNINEKV